MVKVSCYERLGVAKRVEDKPTAFSQLEQRFHQPPSDVDTIGVQTQQNGSLPVSSKVHSFVSSHKRKKYASKNAHLDGTGSRTEGGFILQTADIESLTKLMSPVTPTKVKGWTEKTEKTMAASAEAKMTSLIP